MWVPWEISRWQNKYLEPEIISRCLDQFQDTWINVNLNFTHMCMTVFQDKCSLYFMINSVCFTSFWSVMWYMEFHDLISLYCLGLVCNASFWFMAALAKWPVWYLCHWLWCHHHHHCWHHFYCLTLSVYSYSSYIIHKWNVYLHTPPINAHQVTWACGIYVVFEGHLFVAGTYMAVAW